MIWNLILGAFKSVVGPIFDFLNKRVDAATQVHISDNAAATAITGSVVSGQVEAAKLQAQIRIAEGKWSPWVVMTITGFMAPFAWHTWQVVLDSSRWLPAFGPYYLPTIAEHVVGSWHIAALPGLFETTEHAVIQSLFVGAGVAVGAIPIIKALRGK